MREKGRRREGREEKEKGGKKEEELDEGQKKQDGSGRDCDSEAYQIGKAIRKMVKKLPYLSQKELLLESQR